METIHVTVDNMKCGGCANSIKVRLSKLAGVHRVLVDEASAEVYVEHDGRLLRQDVLNSLRALGYPEVGTGDLMDNMRSYLSCALGRIGPKTT